VSVSRPDEDEPRWVYRWSVDRPNDHLTIRLGAVFRTVIPLPERAAGEPGTYRLRAGLCGVGPYALETTFEVTR
jgi:hypothetical protein